MCVNHGCFKRVRYAFYMRFNGFSKPRIRNIIRYQKRYTISRKRAPLLHFKYEISSKVDLLSFYKQEIIRKLKSNLHV